MMRTRRDHTSSVAFLIARCRAHIHKTMFLYLEVLPRQDRRRIVIVIPRTSSHGGGLHIHNMFTVAAHMVGCHDCVILRIISVDRSTGSASHHAVEGDVQRSTARKCDELQGGTETQSHRY